MLTFFRTSTQLLFLRISTSQGLKSDLRTSDLDFAQALPFLLRSKWILLGKARLLAAMRHLSIDAARLHDEQEIYRDLIDLDPAHSEYYWEMLGQLRLEEVRYQEPTDDFQTICLLECFLERRHLSPRFESQTILPKATSKDSSQLLLLPG